MSECQAPTSLHYSASRFKSPRHHDAWDKARIAALPDDLTIEELRARDDDWRAAHPPEDWDVEAPLPTTEDVAACAERIGIMPRDQAMRHLVPGVELTGDQESDCLEYLSRCATAGPPPDDSGKWVLVSGDRWLMPPDVYEPLPAGWLDWLYDRDCAERDYGEPLPGWTEEQAAEVASYCERLPAKERYVFYQVTDHLNAEAFWGYVAPRFPPRRMATGAQRETSPSSAQAEQVPTTNEHQAPSAQRQGAPLDILDEPKADAAPSSDAKRKTSDSQPKQLDDFWAYLPDDKYIYCPTRELWPASSVNAVLAPVFAGGRVLKPTLWLAQYRAVDQRTWMPGRPEIIEGAAIDQGGMIEREGLRIYNTYRAPAVIAGDPHAAGRWRDHLRVLYPQEADHIERCFAQRIQAPHVKINHALVLAGDQGIGKDTILEPVKLGVGAWNWQEISPMQLMGNFTGHLKAVVLRISEVRDLGDADRYSFYEHTKPLTVTPPDVLRVNEKHMREYYVPNVLWLIMTTNHALTGLYLPADDRRHFIAASNVNRSQFNGEFFASFYGWYEAGGTGHVVAFLRGLDISRFNPKAPPPRTDAFEALVHANAVPEESELADLIETMGSPRALTLKLLRDGAQMRHIYGLAEFLSSRTTLRQVPHRLAECGYELIANPDRSDGRWHVAGKRETVYAKRSLARREQLLAAQGLEHRP